jgi:hypothetical protein
MILLITSLKNTLWDNLQLLSFNLLIEELKQYKININITDTYNDQEGTRAVVYYTNQLVSHNIPNHIAIYSNYTSGSDFSYDYDSLKNLLFATAAKTKCTKSPIYLTTEVFMTNKFKNIGVFLEGCLDKKFQYELATALAKIAVEGINFCCKRRPTYQIYVFSKEALKEMSESLSFTGNIHFIRNKDITPELLLSAYSLFDIVMSMGIDAMTLGQLYDLPCLPIDSSEVLYDQWVSFKDNIDQYTIQSKKFHSTLDENILILKKQLINLLVDLPRATGKETRYFRGLVNSKYCEITDKIGIYIENKYKLKLLENIKKDGINTVYESNNLNKSDLKDLCTIIMLSLTNKSSTPYNWGLENQLLTSQYNLHSSIDWILNDYMLNNPPRFNIDNPTPVRERMYNLGYFYQDGLRGLHRSGWNFVVQNLLNYHNNDGVILDLYCDRTFLWESYNLKIGGKIPIKKLWIGVFHHTFNTEYSSNNLENVFINPLFIESLQTCRAIITLSQYLSGKIRERLEILGLNIPVWTLYHPTEEVDILKKFTWKKFLTNPIKRVVQIGAWLRDTYAIYDLKTPKYLQKTVLKGLQMENYYPQYNILQNLEHALCCVGDMDAPCRSKSTNKYVTGLLASIRAKDASVDTLEYLNNKEYDELLSKNVVFIKLVDASACNTIIECIMRDTPILINRLPATEEYLGKDYPLYYETLEEATEILNDFSKLKSGYKYLKSKNKDFIKVDNFISKLNSYMYSLTQS